MKKVEKIAFYLYIVIEIGLYLSFLIIDFFTKSDSTIIKYISIIIVNLASLFTIIINRKGNYYFVLGLIFTLISDTFLLLINDYYIAGLICFNIVQNLYLFGLKNEISRYFKIQLLVRLIILITCVSISFVTKEYEVMLSSSYIIFLIMNILTLILFCKKDSKNITLLIGFCLFLLCDINVGLNNLGYYFPLDQNTINTLQNVSSNLMWLFYLPSQVLISLYVKDKDQY